MKRYTSETTTWGELEVVRLSDNADQNVMVICPSRGAALLSLTLGGILVIHTEKDFLTNYRFQGAILSPFPNKIKDARYTFNGRNYELEKNDSQQKHAAHGLVYDKPFTIVKIETSAHQTQIDLAYQYRGRELGYPFPFSLTVSYALHQNQGLLVSLTSQNLSPSAIPYGIGFHPYFRLEGGLPNAVLRVPPSELLLVGEDNIPSGATAGWNDFEAGKAVGDTTLNHCFKVNPSLREFEIALQTSPEKRVCLWFDSEVAGFDYFQLYTSHRTHEVAIEPMSCAPNAFNGNQGAPILKAREKAHHRFGIQVESLSMADESLT